MKNRKTAWRVEWDVAQGEELQGGRLQRETRRQTGAQVWAANLHVQVRPGSRGTWVHYVITRSNCIPSGSLNRVPALIGWGKGGMSPL